MKLQRHFFASSAFGWAIAETRDEAIQKLCADQYRELKFALLNMSKRGDIGPYIWSCQVDAPQSAEYSIEYYQPKGVPLQNGVHHYLTYIVKSTCAYMSYKKVPKEVNLVELDHQDEQLSLVENA